MSRPLVPTRTRRGLVVAAGVLGVLVVLELLLALVVIA